jgi:hypothetical protein
MTDREERKHIDVLTRERGIQVQRGPAGWVATCMKDGKKVTTVGATKRASYRKMMEILA